MTGFWQTDSWQKMPLGLVPQCGSCGLYKECQSPKMPVSGKGKKKILIVAEAPGREEDKINKQLVGPAGQKLESMLYNLGINMRQDCWLTNAIICRPEGNRTPTDKEIKYCQPNLSKTILQLSPDVIIPCGRVALSSLIPLAWGKHGEVKNVERWVGWQIPCMKLNAWICPTYHPSYLLRQNDPVLDLHTYRHLADAVDIQSKPWIKVPNLDAMVSVVLDPGLAADHIREITKMGKPVAFDYETTCKKPDSKQATILCCSVSNSDSTVAYPWIGEARLATQELIKSKVPKIGSNIKFEERWTRKEFGHGVTNWYWDTILAAHWLDCRGGICGLKFQAFVLLGMPDYSSHLEQYMGSSDGDEGGGGNVQNKLRMVEPATLLHYCGLDSLLEVLVAREQAERGQYYGSMA